MDNLGVREVPPRKRERERFLSTWIDALSERGDGRKKSMEGRSRWKEEGRRNSVDVVVVVGEPVAKR